MLFVFLSWLTGSPIIAILVLLVILYFIDRRYIGLFPNLGKPLKRLRSISKLRQQLSLSPHNVSSKRELASLLIERRQYKEAFNILQEVKSSSESSAEYWHDLGTALIGLGQLQEGEDHVKHALQLNERVRYGQPYLQLASAFRHEAPAKALDYAAQYGQIHSSSSEAYYLLGSLYLSLDRKEDAKSAFTESIAIYRSLPKYKKRMERKWAVRSYFRRLMTS